MLNFHEGIGEASRHKNNLDSDMGKFFSTFHYVSHFLYLLLSYRVLNLPQGKIEASSEMETVEETVKDVAFESLEKYFRIRGQYGDLAQMYRDVTNPQDEPVCRKELNRLIAEFLTRENIDDLRLEIDFRYYLDGYNTKGVVSQNQSESVFPDPVNKANLYMDDMDETA